jgi:hypothetical protein
VVLAVNVKPRPPARLSRDLGQRGKATLEAFGSDPGQRQNERRLVLESKRLRIADATRLALLKTLPPSHDDGSEDAERLPPAFKVHESCVILIG